MSVSTKTLRAAAAALAIASGVITLSAAPVAAQSAAAKSTVDAAKAGGVVGEQADGFLGVVSNADPAIRGAVAEINAGRAEAYRAIAARTGVSAEAAGQATARELFARLPAGQEYRSANADWRRK